MKRAGWFLLEVKENDDGSAHDIPESMIDRLLDLRGLRKLQRLFRTEKLPGPSVKARKRRKRQRQSESESAVSTSDHRKGWQSITRRKGEIS